MKAVLIVLGLWVAAVAVIAAAWRAPRFDVAPLVWDALDDADNQ